MDGSNPGSSGGGGEGECKLNDDCVCDLCVMFRGIYSYNPESDGRKNRAPASDRSSSSGSSGGCGGECQMDDDGGSRDSARILQEIGMIPESEPVEAPDGDQASVDIGYTTVLGCRMTIAQGKELQEIAETKKPRIPLHVMNKGNVNLKDSSVEIGMIPESEPVEAPDGDQALVDIGYTTVPGCRMTIAQDKELQEIAETKKPRIPLHVMNKGNVNLKDSSVQRVPQDAGAVPPFAPCDHQELNEHVQPNDYTIVPKCFVTKAQDEKVLELACTKKPKIPLHVAFINKINGNLKDSPFYIPLQLVLNHFKAETTKATIKLEAADGIYSVGASKHTDERVVLGSGWDSFVVSHHIQEKDLLIFRSTEKSRLEVIIIDPSGHEKKPSSPVTGNPSSSTQETSGDSVHSVDPPPPEVFDLSSSDDDDDIVREGTEESSRAQKRVTRSCAKIQKIASTSSPSTKSGPGACKPRDRPCRKLEVGSKPLPKNLEGPSQRPYILPLGVTLPFHAVKKIEKKVQEIRSELPIFVKVMNISSVAVSGSRACEMLFCVEYADACLPDRRQALFLQLEGEKRLWETMLAVRRFKHSKQRRILEGWKEFSMQNGLEVGDICLFKVDDANTGSLKMTVYLIRRA